MCSSFLNNRGVWGYSPTSRSHYRPDGRFGEISEVWLHFLCLLKRLTAFLKDFMPSALKPKEKTFFEKGHQTFKEKWD
jgi:hypothetical protein